MSYDRALNSKHEKSKVGSIVRRLFEEKKEGTGPHIGKNGPLMTNRKQIIAVAYAKARRGEK